MKVDETELLLTPEEAVAAWPRLEPLAMMWSGGPSWRVRNPRCRWTILARPTETRTVIPGPDAADEIARLFADMEISNPPALDRAHPADLPFVGGWLGYISYEAGAILEPAAAASPVESSELRSPWPLAAWQRCPGAYVHDRWTGQWWVVGDRDALPDIETPRARETGPFVVGALRSAMGRAEYERRVARAVEYIRAGDIFQANVAHQLVGPFEGSTRALFMELASRARPWNGAYLELEIGTQRAAIASMSPELFLEYDASSRRAVTRPMKGTRPVRSGDPSASVRELARSEKDAAELNMIVDLMRNDLGRVCSFGTVQVEEGRVIESHGAADSASRVDAISAGDGGGGGDAVTPGSRGDSGGLLQGVATIRGDLRPELGLTDLLFATFPPGSVTGAPKIRAMQIIDELETAPRGPYCGAIGYISDHGRVGLSVAIRTALVRGAIGGISADEIADGELSYSVGAGIVADSRPNEEWRETLVKASAITGLTGFRET